MLTNGTFASKRRSLLRKSLRTGFVIILGVVLAAPLWARDEGRMVGIRFGTITTGVDSEVDACLNTDWRTGLSAGGFVSIEPASHFSLGAGLDLHFRPFAILFDGRYTLGLRNLNKDPQGSESLTSRAWGFAVCLGWPF